MKRGAAGRGSKISLPNILVPGQRRDEQNELRLRLGQSFIDMETTFQRTAVFIAREADRIVGKHQVQKVLKQRERGKWSHDAIDGAMQTRAFAHKACNVAA